MKAKCTLALLLAGLLTFPALTACGSGNTDTAETTADTAQMTAETAPAETEHQLAPNDYNGKQFNLYVWDTSNISTEKETGEVLNDAVFRRNVAVEEFYNVKFAYTVASGNSKTYTTWYNTISGSILAGDDAYQLVGGYAYRLAKHTLDGNYQNLLSLQYLDFTQPWWIQSMQKEGNLGGKLFNVLGNFDVSYYDSTYVILFNKKIANDLKLDNLYETVKEGKWVFDTLAEYSKLGAKDLNGDGKMTVEDDQFGASYVYSMGVDAFFSSCEVVLTEHDSNGIPKLLGLTDRFVEVQEACIEYLLKSGAVNYTTSQTSPEFMEGRALFEGTSCKRARTYREMDNDFGILPYPKWDEEQEEYHTYNAYGNNTSFCIPVTTDGNSAACILEALAYLGYRDVTPVYHEQTLRGKTVRDSESVEMLDLIFNGVGYDFTQIYSYNFGDQKAPYMLLRMTLKNGGTGIASAWATDAELYKTTMETLISTLTTK